MSRRGQSQAEARALAHLESILELNDRERDALPGTVVRLVKEAKKELRRREILRRG